MIILANNRDLTRLALLFVTVAVTFCVLVQGARAQDPPWPTTPPVQVCGNSDLLNGPSAPPEGAVTVPAGDNSGFDFNRPGATLWFEPGVHTLGTDVFAQIIARDRMTYVGAPGAVIDGQNRNLYAFTGDVSDVTVKHLTIRNFGRGLDNNNEGVVNHDSGVRWTVESNTISGNDGAGVFLGSGNVVRHNCLKDNGQYGFSMFRPPVEGQSAITDIVLDGNEISGNNTDDWERLEPGCGCTGGGKFWDVKGARVTNNWVHDNRSTGLWADTNNIDFLFEGNYIDSNDGEGIWYEISYNATIRHNTIRRNAWVSGRSNQGSPGAAVYLSESGGDARLASAVSGAPEVRLYENSFEDNFSGVSIFENGNRFCNSNGNTSKGYCTPVVTPTLLPEEPRDYEYPNPISTEHPCFTMISEEPYRTDCRWHSQNIQVHDNEFRFDDTVVPCAGPFCGAQALYAQGADNIPWSPYTIAGVQNAVMFENDNRFYDNRYVGNWRFAKGSGETIRFDAWQAAPYNQDAGSTIEGETEPPDPSPVANDLDAATSSLEGSIGAWEAWYSSAIERDSSQAHGGRHSLRVDVTEPYGWGVQLGNWPGFPAAHGVKRIRFWAKLGSASAMRPKLTVKWRGGRGATLKSHSVTLDGLTTSWKKFTAVVDAPAGTHAVDVSLTGRDDPGEHLYLDDVVVGDSSNILDAESAGFDGAVGHWQPWYAASLSASTQEAYRGTASLQLDITEPAGWGAQLDNWPGFAARPGPKRISYWAKQGVGLGSEVTLRVRWFNADGAIVETTLVPLDGLTTSWRQAVASVTAPPDTTQAYFDITSESGSPGDSVYVDDIVATDVGD